MRYNPTPLIIAAKIENLEIAERLIEVGASFEEGDSRQRTALRYPARTGNVAVTKILLRFGANPEARDIDLATPAMSAIGQGHLEIIKTLSRDVPNLQKEDCFGDTLLHYAGVNQNIEIFFYLIATGGSFDIAKENKTGESVMFCLLAYAAHSVPAVLNLIPSYQIYPTGQRNIITLEFRRGT